MRERLISAWQFLRDGLAAHVADMQRRVNGGAPTITREKIEQFAALL